MAPLIHDSSEISISSHDVYYDPKTIRAPLHEAAAATLHENRKRVSFDDMDTVYEIPNLKDFTRREKKKSWYTLKDMNRMKDDVRNDAKVLEFGILIRGTCVSNRGIECRTRAGAIRKRQLRMDVYAAVFDEIEFQRREGFIDEEVIADTYFVVSLESAREAHLVAKQDEAEAMAMHDRKLKDSTSYLQFYPSVTDPSN
eukprot:CAMPEP_0197187500 /NCGR_PEP_ID=MMETSP1423-20130617/15957_1 /TAXON_ID=476441 /ORGANISM="Pseudo-nitzschia heimii, Strain UNC1101" /LENGTH=198 /DNA_ID=CAMNT_0042639081 /DNA_START=140 /DNA_END=736 /DNA_ORIENTATION=-